MPKPINGNAVGPEVEPDKVWGCGVCNSQGHRLMDGGVIKCGECGGISLFEHYEPHEKKPGHERHPMRLVASKYDSLENFICGRCGYSRFEAHQSGTLSCHRCRHAVQRRWFNPASVEGRPDV